MKLGTLLIRDGIINLDQLEAALRAQVLFGGKLGTNLVELGHLTLDQLALYLGRTLGVPAAMQERFESVDEQAVRRFPPALAQRYVVCPLGWEGDPPALALAMADPRDRRAVEEIEQAIGHPVRPYVAPELRILFYLERRYGLERKVRFVRIAPPERVPTERRRVVDPGDPPPPLVFGSGPPPPAAPAPPAAAAPPPPLPLGDALRALEDARSRDEVADAVLAYATGRLEATLLFLLKEGLALGWRGAAPGVPLETIETLSVPLAAPSCLASAFGRREPWRGAPADHARAIHERLWQALRARPPDEVLAVPVLIGQRVVNLIYAHAPGGGALDDGVVDGLLAIAAAAGDSYARMIQAAKRKAVD